MYLNLHDAIEFVLERAGRAVSTTDIARCIRDEDLWIRPTDGEPPSPAQVRARAVQYRDREKIPFVIAGDMISLDRTPDWVA
jgi:hypothetical protein